MFEEVKATVKGQKTVNRYLYIRFETTTIMCVLCLSLMLGRFVIFLLFSAKMYNKIVRQADVPSTRINCDSHVNLFLLYEVLKDIQKYDMDV